MLLLLVLVLHVLAYTERINQSSSSHLMIPRLLDSCNKADE